MANNEALIKQCEQLAKEWLSPSFDEETRKVLPEPRVRNRRSARYHGCRYEPYEQVYRRYGHTGLRQLYQQSLPW